MAARSPQVGRPDPQRICPGSRRLLWESEGRGRFGVHMKQIRSHLPMAAGSFYSLSGHGPAWGRLAFHLGNLRI